MNAVQAHQYKVVVHDHRYAMQSHVSFIARRERRNERALVHWGCVLVLVKVYDMLRKRMIIRGRKTNW